MTQPKTLQEAIKHFSNPDNALAYMVSLRWPNGVVCPTCDRKDARFLANQSKWQCKSVHAKRQFSVKVGTIFEDSPISLEKWLTAVWMIANCKNGVSSYEVARAIGVTQKSAWFMMHRIRLAMQSGSFLKIGGEGKPVEVDETFIGGKARHMHKSKRAIRITSTGMKDKTPVVGILERGGQVRTAVIPNRRKNVLHAEIRKHVSADSLLFTDSLPSYEGLEAEYAHKVIDHAVAYVDGAVHTNGLENYRSLLKRGLKGTYVSVETFHLFRYLDEQAFRFNNRGSKDVPVNDGQRFDSVLSHVLGKRLTYAEVTGKVGTTDSESSAS
ncbi:MAG TPA: IS1595 family transposase [Candidatus Acidoferrales bacterium]|jgi:transposase-like protein|nr:IS1595 family transposase [Candidatus Acidoferrales bacterium]